MSEIKKVPKRGISTYCSLSHDGLNMSWKISFMHMEDMGAPGLEFWRMDISRDIRILPTSGWLKWVFSGGEIP